MRKIIHIEVGSELNDMLKNQAKKEYTTVSALVRNIIREYIGDPQNETFFTRSKKKVEQSVDEFEQSLKETL